MRVKIIKIGNSRGIRLPKQIIDLYGLKEGQELEIEKKRDGIFFKPCKHEYSLSWEEAYQEMAAEREEASEWEEWDTTSGDGLDD